MSQLPEDPDVATGFTSVDAQPDPSVLVAGMEETARWPAVQQLRAWERQRLALAPGDRLLDVGCGLGDVASALAADVAPGGAVLGIDASEAMLAAARLRALDVAGAVEFRIGDAQALDLADASFDACRCERALQWVPDMERAVAEMVRVLRPGGRLVLIDSDWRTMAADLPDQVAVDAVLAGLVGFRGPAAAAGGRLLNIVREHGLAEIECTAAAHAWTDWDPDTEPGPSGLFPLRAAVTELAESGALDPELAARFVDAAVEGGRRDRFYMSLTMVAVSGRTT